jgi:membrane-associated HD superfamily phosphohydrolase
MIIDILLSFILFTIFGLIGIYFSGRNKYLKKNLNKQNLTILSIIYIIFIAILMKDLEGNTGFNDQLIFSLGNFVPTYLGALLAIGIKMKFKRFFVNEFYFALFGSIILGSALLLIAYA